MLKHSGQNFTSSEILKTSKHTGQKLTKSKNIFKHLKKLQNTLVKILDYFKQ
jgi:hypothetical protein